MTDRNTTGDLSRTEPRRIHPLFDPNSLYRLTTQYSIFADGGEQSIQEFFEQLRKEKLRNAWTSTSPPQEVQDWGFSAELNEAIHDVYREAAAAEKQVALPPQSAEDAAERAARLLGQYRGSSGARAESRASAAGGEKLPLFTIDLESNTLSSRSEPNWLFTGCGATEAKGEIKRFSADVPGIEEGRRCLLLLMPRPLVEHLFAALGADEPPAPHFGEDLPRNKIPSHRAAADVLRKLFDPETFEPADPEKNIPGYRKAGHLATLLSCAAAIEGVAEVSSGEESARFTVTVDLDRSSPALPVDTSVVLCLGPKESP